ncbi:MAG: RNA polymerase factor sigma-54 [Acidobacteriota bacterium]
MSPKPTVQLRLAHKLIMTPSLQYAIKLLPMSALELEATISTELRENPVLEDAGDEIEFEEIAEETQEEAAAEEKEAAESVEPAETPAEEPVQEEAGETKGEEPEGTQEKELRDIDDLEIERFFADYPDDDWRPSRLSDTSELPSFENTLGVRPTLSSHLYWQLDCTPCSDRLMEIGVAIIGNLEEDGYLRTPLEEICAMGPYELDEVQQALAIVQNFDPAGVAGRSMQECLLIQLAHLGLDGTLTETLVRDHLDLILVHDYASLAARLECSPEELQRHLDIIRHLDAQPGLKYQTREPFFVVPDVYVLKVEDEYVIRLNDEGVPRLRVNPTYARMLLSRSMEHDPEGKRYLKERFKSALWLIKSLDQRDRTIYKVSESIVRHQRSYLERGKSSLKPMVLRDVAEDIGVHESTVGRVVANKYMQTPQGIVPLKFFFNRGLNNESGETISTITIKQKIRDLIHAESPDVPLSDSRIASLLRGDRLRIARRTVAKYREELNIPPSNRRRVGFTHDVTPGPSASDRSPAQPIIPPNEGANVHHHERGEE